MSLDADTLRLFRESMDSYTLSPTGYEHHAPRDSRPSVEVPLSAPPGNAGSRARSSATSTYLPRYLSMSTSAPIGVRPSVASSSANENSSESENLVEAQRKRRLDNLVAFMHDDLRATFDEKWKLVVKSLEKLPKLSVAESNFDSWDQSIQRILAGTPGIYELYHPTSSAEDHVLFESVYLGLH